MTDTELKEFGEAVKRLDELYPGEQFGLEIGGRRIVGTARFIARVGGSDTCKFGYGDKPLEAVNNLVGRAGSGDARRRMAAQELRDEASRKLQQAAQLEAQSV